MLHKLLDDFDNLDILWLEWKIVYYIPAVIVCHAGMFNRMNGEQLILCACLQFVLLTWQSW